MSDPRGEYGFLDFFLRNGMVRSILQSHAQSAHAGGAEANLFSGTVPMNTLKNTGDVLIVKARGTCAANANAKRIRALLGTMVLADSVSSTSWNGHNWELTAVVALTGATAQKSQGSVIGATAAGAAAVLGTQNAPTTGTEDPKTDLTLTIKGTGVAGSDVVLEQLEVYAAGKNG